MRGRSAAKWVMRGRWSAAAAGWGLRARESAIGSPELCGFGLCLAILRFCFPWLGNISGWFWFRISESRWRDKKTAMVCLWPRLRLLRLSRDFVWACVQESGFRPITARGRSTLAVVFKPNTVEKERWLYNSSPCEQRRCLSLQKKNEQNNFYTCFGLAAQMIQDSDSPSKIMSFCFKPSFLIVHVHIYRPFPPKNGTVTLYCSKKNRKWFFLQ